MRGKKYAPPLELEHRIPCPPLLYADHPSIGPFSQLGEVIFRGRHANITVTVFWNVGIHGVINFGCNISQTLENIVCSNSGIGRKHLM